ncbi:histone deacetylase family protein [Caulobacter rhizosphaerae]|jgi:acetoin utilization deacetylase AcuC-like enzyme|uniref:histone deacetylase family protein n=1 Tax=Caulobacter rhizosphaerae TaxID=2010972 RepID=UPI0013D487A2|nr:histone deacetylase [Caulobacter rhizosphaerae]GGL20686.1 histone deacetylase [Caulobacter rhizosphaerae]
MATSFPPIVHHPAFRAEMPAGHRFPMDKFARLAAVLEAEGVAGPAGFVRPDPIDLDSLLMVHDEAYVRGVIDLTLPADVARRVGLPNTESVARRAQAAVGGTLAAARLALAHGIACNTAGGSHHAQADTGAGFCVFNDVAVAARRLLAEGKVGQVLVVDLDVHQGDGTARIFEGDPSVFTFSMHAEKNFPARKAVSDLDIDLPDGTSDEAYLQKLMEVVPDLLAHVAPDLVFFNAGVDPHADDKLGRLGLSDEGLARREAFVLGSCLERRIPVAGVIGGGYDADIDRLAHRHALLHRAARAALSA